jgi:hypothetical protein
MSKLLNKWHRENVDRDGHYAVFTGFEKAIGEHMFSDIYDELDIDDKVALFDFVTEVVALESAMMRGEK